MLPYVIITAARNEEAHLPALLESVIRQTQRPAKWVIVSDGSTDRTDAIVQEAAARHSWIELVRVTDHGHRDFASKVHAFNAGYERVSALPYAIIGNLDADISFEHDYLEYLLAQFEGDPRLGVAGTPFVEGDEAVYDYRYTNVEHVSGGCQLFRRECFERIGGFHPIREGGEDWVAVTSARMQGWRTRTFTDRHFRHHRPMGTVQGGFWTVRFNDGRNDYLFGNHPLWQLSRALYQAARKPYLVGGLALLAGYTTTALRRRPRRVAPDLMSFTRREQMARLRAAVRRLFV